MRRSRQSALARYRERRGQAPAAPVRAGFRHRRWVRLGLLAALLAVVWFTVGRPRETVPVKLTYELDLSDAATGLLVITLICDGELPPHLDLALPPGVFGDPRGSVHARDPVAHELGRDGRQVRPLRVEVSSAGWRLETRGSRRAGVVYSLDLRATPGSEQDIRRHISTPVAGGVRAAGFEIFLEPLGIPVTDVTVQVHNPSGMPLLVPWPALVRDGGPRAATSAVADPGQANLGFGQGFRPAAGLPAPAAGETPAAMAPVPTNLVYRPRDLADLNNALLVCGDIRTQAAQAGECVVQLATDRDWLFADEAALDLVRRIARTEMAFFGSAPSDQITVLLSANDVTGEERFDVYGVHTGSSVLVMLDRDTTWGMLEEQAASVIAHEMFHGWLGEAVRQTEPSMLWFTEGATTWYAARMLTAAGIWRPDHARGVLGARLDRDYANNGLLGRLSVSAAAAEVMATAEQVRYGYAGGVTACVALDEMLAGASGRARPLDEVVRRLYRDYRGQSLTRERLEAAVEAVTGVRCGPWLDTYVYGKTTLPPVAGLL
ncbi:MAG: hypothetical protein IPK64_05560 [bacterium]|nr:hypothetical protein [bacterium]